MTIPIFPLLFALYPVLYVAVANPGQASARSVTRASLMAVLVSASVLLAMRIPFRSWHRAGLAAGLVVFFFFAYGPIYSVIEVPFLESVAGTAGPVRHLRPIAPYLHHVLSLLWTGSLAVALWSIRRLPDGWTVTAVRSCNVMGFVLLALLAGQWLVEQPIHDKSTDRTPTLDRGLHTTVTGYKPDVYIVVLDGYARGDVLREHYAFDNSEFLRALKERRFVTAELNNANYAWTFLSLASYLNMDYVHAITSDKLQPSEKSRSVMYEAIRNNQVAQFLRARGYRIVHFQSTSGETLDNPYADEQVACNASVFTNDFVRVLVEMSWLKVLESRLSVNLAECHLSNFENLGRMGREPGPKFVFVHVLPPHHPYLFDRDGRVLRTANVSNQFEFQKRLWRDKASYLNQLVYVNSRIIEAVDAIIATSPMRPLIGIVSDHGPTLEGVQPSERVRARMANFAAYHLPDDAIGVIPADGSSVNHFRRLFDHYFRGGFGILPDCHYYSDFLTPYAFELVDVRGGLIRQAPNAVNAACSEGVPFPERPRR